MLWGWLQVSLRLLGGRETAQLKSQGSPSTLGAGGRRGAVPVPAGWS